MNRYFIYPGGGLENTYLEFLLQALFLLHIYDCN